MTTLYIAWQDSHTRHWHTVGKLTKNSDVYCFTYTQGALASPHFQPLGRMFDLFKPYYSHALFPLFANRVLNKSRAEYPAYVSWLALNPDIEQEPMKLLARSGGKRAADELYIFPYPEVNDSGQVEIYFLSHGLRHLSTESLCRIERLKEGERLTLRHETDNSHDQFALLLESGESVKVGYYPRYLSRDLKIILDNTTVNLSVAKLNHNAPLQFRLLCKAEFTMPTGIEVFASNEYQVLTQNNMEAA